MCDSGDEADGQDADPPHRAQGELGDGHGRHQDGAEGLSRGCVDA